MDGTRSALPPLIDRLLSGGQFGCLDRASWAGTGFYSRNMHRLAQELLGYDWVLRRGKEGDF